MSAVTEVHVVNQTVLSIQSFTLTTIGTGFSSIHGALSGLDVDDHPQYLTASRADLRFYTKAQIDALPKNYYISEQRFQDFTNQEPTGLDLPLPVKYGPAITSPNGNISVDANGIFRVLKGGPYLIKSNLRVSRTGSSGVSHIFLWVESSVDGVNFVPANVSIRITIDNSSTDAHLYDSSPIFLPAGIYVRTMVARSSTGHDSGGLFSEAPSAALAAIGIGADPSASLEWHILNGYNYQ